MKIIRNLVERFIIGSDPFRIEDLWHRVYTYDHDYRHPELTTTAALSTIEMACWDIIGKYLHQPIYNLLSGIKNEKLRAYSYIIGGESFKSSPEEAAQIVVEMKKQGLTAIKFDPFPPISPGPRDASLTEINNVSDILKEIREEIGDKMEICIETHGQFTTYSAFRISKMLEEHNAFWFEEPVPPENVNEMAWVAMHTNVPIATGEHLVTKFEFLRILEKHAAQIIQLDVGHCGGILESKKIAGIEAYYASIATHMYCGPVAAAAAIQVSVCNPNFLIQEYNITDLHERLLKSPISLKKGYIIPPKAPGLGVEIDEETVKEHPYRP